MVQFPAAGVHHHPQGHQRPAAGGRAPATRTPCRPQRRRCGTASAGARPSRGAGSRRSARCTRAVRRVATRREDRRVVADGRAGGPAQLAGEHDVTRLENGVERTAEAGDQCRPAAAGGRQLCASGRRGADPCRRDGRPPMARRCEPRAPRARAAPARRSHRTGVVLAPLALDIGSAQPVQCSSVTRSIRGLRPPPPRANATRARERISAATAAADRCAPRPPSSPANRCRSRRPPEPGQAPRCARPGREALAPGAARKVAECSRVTKNSSTVASRRPAAGRRARAGSGRVAPRRYRRAPRRPPTARRRGTARLGGRSPGAVEHPLHRRADAGGERMLEYPAGRRRRAG